MLPPGGTSGAIDASRAAAASASGMQIDLAQLGGDLDDRRGLGDPLDVVGLEKRRVLRPAQHVVELPGQVGRVAQAGAHPLAGERRRLVRGVAGEEDASDVPPGGPASPETVASVAHELGVVGPDVPGLEECPGARFGVEGVEGLARGGT